MADQGPNYTPADAVPVDISTTDFDLTTQFKGQPYAQRLAVGATGALQVKLLSGRIVIYNVINTSCSPVFITGLFTKVVRAGSAVAFQSANTIIAEQ